MSQVAAPAAAPDRPHPLAAFKPLLLDLAIPLGSYYLLHSALGLDLLLSLALSSVVPAAHSLADALRKRTFNALATVMVVVNVLSMALSFTSGDARLMMAKDSVLSSFVGLSILWSVARGRPMMTAGLKPLLIKTSAAKSAAWDRLSATDTRFRRHERTFSLVWGAALLTECVARVIGAYTLPVETMASWGSTAMLLGAIALGIVAGGALAVAPMEKLLEEATAETA
ncbi:VC0807 family protein [Streptomyces luteireticuli]|uniref:VC0807 family protein n=1 Tax=Streptomyces luteireticuli TaxID=173858 RepID=UPI003557356F